MIKVLHTGDIHLGDLNGPTKDGKNLRREDTLNCMRAIVNRARLEMPNVTIIAGDLFNRSRVWADTALEDVNDAITEFIRPLCAVSDAVVLLFGTMNHDNPRAFEVIRKTTEDLRNLHIYTTPGVDRLNTAEGPVQIVAVPGFDKARIRLFCPGLDKEEENRNATALVNDIILGLSAQLDKDAPAILTAHYTVSGAVADNGNTFLAGQDVVILPAIIDAANVDLACFGHIHKPQRLASNTPAYYCGSPNQLTFNDEGERHGFWIHEIAESVNSTFIETPERCHYTLRIGPDEVAEFITSGLFFCPFNVEDAIVRVRYSCTAEQEKAFNRAEFQKVILSAGAFHVSEVIPEDVEILDARNQITEHDGPSECLERWLRLNDVPEDTTDRLMELAEPIIRQADDGREDGKHVGAFTPRKIEVKNYRSYTEASFDFEPVHMAMVNGANGVGKSSLFMDALADCLYEQSRKEDIGGWVRDGTKSGAITFTFGMGGQDYRVIRTRTKSGRGTLALQRQDSDSGEWINESDTTMKLTQAKIERLLGMDCNTFCSIALIRQDAYGLFLEASSDRRMEVLSALLGLDIYSRMEELAKANATEQRRRIAAAKERISILGEQIEQKESLLHEDSALQEEIRESQEQIESLEAMISAEERSEAMRKEILSQVESKEQEAKEYGRQASEKVLLASQRQRELEKAQALASALPVAMDADKCIKEARTELESLQEQVKRHAAVNAELGEHKKAVDRNLARLSDLQKSIEDTKRILSQKQEIEGALRSVAELHAKQAEAKERLSHKNEAAKRLQKAGEDFSSFVAESRRITSELTIQLQNLQREADRLSASGCPISDKATCVFMSSAVEAKSKMQSVEDKLHAIKLEHRIRYDELAAAHDKERQEYDSLGDPYNDMKDLDAQERALIPLLNLAPSLAAAEARLAELESSLRETQDRQAEEESRSSALLMEMCGLSRAVDRAKDLSGIIEANQEKADMLNECSAATATVEALRPQIEDLYRESIELEKKSQNTAKEAEDIRSRVPQNITSVTALRYARDKHKLDISTWTTRRGAISAKMEAITEAETQIASLRKETEEIAAKLNDYTTLVKAFGLDGIQYMIIRGVVPEIMHRSNEILTAMTGGKMAIDIRTEREQKSSKQIVNSLEVWINTLAGGSRPYLSHSGGEKVRISLAVTLGLADVKAHRTGVQLGMLWIDEPPFLDSEGTEAYADALQSMAQRNPAMRILAISHDPAMKGRFPQNIIVSAGENGSTVTME